MVKVLPIGVVLALMIAAVIYLSWFRQPAKISSPPPQTTFSDFTKNLDSDSAAITPERIRTLEESVRLLAQEVVKLSQNNNLAATPAQTVPANAENRIKNLETAVGVLQKQVSQPASTTTTQTPTTKSTIYIPLGWTGAATTLDWTAIKSQTITLDPGDYPGYSNMQFEVSLRDFQANGKAYARIFNVTDGTSILSSEVTTTSQDYTWVISDGFTLPSGKKTYSLQLKTLTGYESSVQTARIRVNF